MCLNSSDGTDMCQHGGFCSSSLASCVCSSACFVGNYCEINYNAVRLPLTGAIVQDSLAARDIYIFSFGLFVFLGLVNNILSLMTFLREHIRLTVCGLYLIIFSILNLFLMIILLSYIMTIIRYNNPTYLYWACHIVPFISLIMVDGSILFTVAIAVERVLIECFNFGMYGSRMRASIVSIIIIAYVCGTNIDEIFLRRISNDLTGAPRCTYDFERYPTWRRVDIVFSYAHVVIPCVVHLICTICVLTSIARRKIFINSTDRGLVSVWLHQLFLHRDFLIPPLCLIICILPHGILGHLLQTCIPYSDTFKLRLHITFILLLYVPQMLTFVLYVCPSPIYLKEFQHTIIYRTLFRSCYRRQQLRRQRGSRLSLLSRSRTVSTLTTDALSMNSAPTDEQL